MINFPIQKLLPYVLWGLVVAGVMAVAVDIRDTYKENEILSADKAKLEAQLELINETNKKGKELSDEKDEHLDKTEEVKEVLHEEVEKIDDDGCLDRPLPDDVFDILQFESGY